MKTRVTLTLNEQFRTIDRKDSSIWIVANFVEAGAKGVTPITRPALRWGGDLLDLRELGIPIDPTMEPNEVSYPGLNSCYFFCEAEVRLLASKVLTGKGTERTAASFAPVSPFERHLINKHNFPDNWARTYHELHGDHC